MKWVRIILFGGLLGIVTQGVGLSQNMWSGQLSEGHGNRGLTQETNFFPPSLRATGSTYTNRLFSDVLPDTLDSHSSEFPSPRSVDRKSTRLNSSHVAISYAVFCLQNKRHEIAITALPVFY